MDTRNHLFNSVDSFKEILTSFLQEKSHLHKIEKDILMDKLRALYIEISEHPESARLLTFDDFPNATSEEELPDVEVEVFEMPEAPLVTTVASETISVPESVQVPEPVVEAEIPAFDFSSQSELQSAKVEEASTVVEDQTPELSPSIEEPTHVEISQPEVTDTIEPEVESSQEPEPIVPTVVPPPIIPSEPLNKLEKLLNDLKDLTGNSEEQKPATDENGDVVFDLNLTKKEERPLSYYAIERKLALEEKGISEEEAAQQSPKVSIVNPFVGKPTQQNVPPAETTRVIPPHLQEQLEKKEETAPQVPAAELNVETNISHTQEEEVIIETPVVQEEVNSVVEAPKPKINTAFSIESALDFAGNPALRNQLRLKPIENLKNGIGLNEKFLYIRELFSNDHIMFANVVSAINDLSSMAEAEQYIMNQYISTGRWQEDNPHVNGFLQIIFRRFAH